MYYRMDPETTMTVERIDAYISDFKVKQLPRLNKLRDYYVGEQAIKKRGAAYGKPNNQIVHPFGNYITDINTGYFLGEPITYTCTTADDQQTDATAPETKNFLQRTVGAVKRVAQKIKSVLGLDLLARLTDINAYNDEAAANADIGTDASIYGVADELLYIDQDSKIRFAPVDPRSIILVTDNTVEERLLYGIRFWSDTDITSNEIVEYAEVHSRRDRTTFKRVANSAWEQYGQTVPHIFGEVPINPYANNRLMIGDYELVISLIDAYDKTQSDSVNDAEAFADAYLALTGIGDDLDFGPSEDGSESDGQIKIRAMKDNRVLILPEGGDAKWVIKAINDTYLENLKTRIASEIHKFSKTPALTDQDFAANASGVAIKYKLMGLEAAAAKKERAFRKGLQRRIEMICNALKVYGYSYDYTDIGMSFKRNVPANFTEIAEVLSKIGDLLSKETKVGLLPIDTTYAQERVKIKAETEDGYSVPLGDPDDEV